MANETILAWWAVTCSGGGSGDDDIGGVGTTRRGARRTVISPAGGEDIDAISSATIQILSSVVLMGYRHDRGRGRMKYNCAG